MEFEVPIGKNGDCFDRYLVRMEEMRQSVSIMRQAIAKLRTTAGPVHTLDGKVAPPKRAEMKRSMEALIHHFKLYTGGLPRAGGRGLRGRRGAQGASSASTSSPTAPTSPTGCKIRAPGFAHLQAMDSLCEGHMLADVAAILGSLDIVFGEVDR